MVRHPHLCDRVMDSGQPLRGFRNDGGDISAACQALARSADATVLYSSMVTVIGPTPPGTGVM
jgi:hypothetical protein